MRRVLVVAFLLASGAVFSVPVSAATKVIKFGTLVDGTGRVLKNAFVVVENDRISAVTTSPPSAPGAELIDLSAYTGLPGLIDVHTHMARGPMPPRRPITSVVLGRESALKALEIGVTTVRDLGSMDGDDIAMRDLINMGNFPGPRMFVSGCSLHVSRSVFQPGGTALTCGTGDGPAEFVKNVRQQIAAGADVIKVFASTGSGQDVSGFQTATYDELKAAIEVAHNYGKRVAVHTYGPGGARDAVRAGTDSLEHATDIDDETITEMVRRKTWYVPTIDHNRYYADNGDALGYAPGYKDRLNDFIQRNLESARRAFKAGVRFAMGSDAIYSMWGENTRELGWFIKAGMTPEQALNTTTKGAAELLGMEKSLGSVAPGYFADLVAVEGDPLQDINVVINNVRWVMKAGIVVSDKRKAGKSN